MTRSEAGQKVGKGQIVWRPASQGYYDFILEYRNWEPIKFWSDMIRVIF